jgi:hypothetical protein
MQTSMQHYQDMRPVFEGKKPFTDVVPFPDSYQTYLDLGRFRNALLLDEEKKRPTPGLNEFINDYGLRGYSVVATAER